MLVLKRVLRSTRLSMMNFVWWVGAMVVGMTARHASPLLRRHVRFVCGTWNWNSNGVFCVRSTFAIHLPHHRMYAPPRVG